MPLSRDEATIDEKSTPTWYGQLEKAVRVGGKTLYQKLCLAEIQTLTLDYYDTDASSTIINSRTAQNVLNANNVTVRDDGEIFWDIQQADSAIQGTPATGDLEKHVAMFTITTTAATGSKVFYKFLDLYVKQLLKVT